MSDHRYDGSAVLLIALDAVLWVVGVLLFLGAAGNSGENIGELLTIVAATLGVIVSMRAWQLRMHRAFVHGYHAGYHDALRRECEPLEDECEVFAFSEIKARRLSRLN